MMILDEIKNIVSTKKELKKFGYTVGGVLVVLGLVLKWFGAMSSMYFISIGILLLVLGLTLPEVLLPFQKLWMSISVVLGFVMTRIILTLLFYFVITPTAFAARIFGKDFLKEKIDKSETSYWNYKDKTDYEKTSTERQF